MYIFAGHEAGIALWIPTRQKIKNKVILSQWPHYAQSRAAMVKKSSCGAQWASRASGPAWSHSVCVGAPVGSSLFSCRYCAVRLVRRRPIVLRHVPWLSAISAGPCLKPLHYGVALLALLHLPRRLFAFSNVPPTAQAAALSLPYPHLTLQRHTLAGECLCCRQKGAQTRHRPQALKLTFNTTLLVWSLFRLLLYLAGSWKENVFCCFERLCL